MIVTICIIFAPPKNNRRSPPHKKINPKNKKKSCFGKIESFMYDQSNIKFSRFIGNINQMLVFYFQSLAFIFSIINSTTFLGELDM